MSVVPLSELPPIPPRTQRFYRIARESFAEKAVAFSGLGASKYPHRWTRPASALRAVYTSDSLALACLETLVHIRPLPRRFPPSVFFSIDLPLSDLETANPLPAGWDGPLSSEQARDLGNAFLRSGRKRALVVPTCVVPIGFNAIVNPLAPSFDLTSVNGPFHFIYDGRLE